MHKESLVVKIDTIHTYATHSCGLEYHMVPKVASNSIKSAINQSNARKERPRRPIDLRFSIVRHPLSRLASAYVEKIQTGKTRFLMQPQWLKQLPQSMTIAEFVDFLLGFPIHQHVLNSHFCPQSWLTRGLDFVGTLENIKEDWAWLQEGRGLADLPHEHPTPNRKSWRQLLDAETEAKARKFYREDFERWPQYNKQGGDV